MTEGVHELLRLLPERDWWGRRSLISNLLKYPEEEFLPYLEAGVRNHENADIRNTSMEVFKALGPKALPSLAALLKDKDPEVRLFTVNILCEIGDKRAVPLLYTSIDDADVNVRSATVEALGRIGDRQVLRALKKSLEDESWVAMAAINAIGEIGGEDALNILYGCLEKKVFPEIALLAIEKAGDRHSIRHLSKCFYDVKLRGPSLRAIVRIFEREGIRPHPEYFMSIVPALIDMLGSPHAETKKYAFMALCWARDVVALPHLIEAVKDEELQECAIEGLLDIGRVSVCYIVDELKASSGRHRGALAKVLSMIGENKALLQFAHDEDPEVRAEAALAIGSLRMERAVKTLLELLEDPVEEVRRAARKSILGLEKNG